MIRAPRHKLQQVDICNAIGATISSEPRRPQSKPRPPCLIAGRRVRVSPDYRLIRQDQLSLEQSKLVGNCSDDPEYYGLLVPQERLAFGVKAIDHDVARLIVTLGDQSSLVETLMLDGNRSSIVPDARTRLIARLILDGILEIEESHGFVTGPSATRGLLPETHSTQPRNILSKLSTQALQDAYQVVTQDPTELSWWLYGYNVIPLSPAWLRRLGNSEYILRCLGLKGSGGVARRLQERFDFSRSSHWFSWHRHGVSDHQAEARYKLYLSPHPSAFMDCLQLVLPVLSTAEMTGFKIGRGASGLLRPDKLVLYFNDWKTMHLLGTMLMLSLHDMRVQGVPYTATFSSCGLLSWGMDPPVQGYCAPGTHGESWRLWLTNRLSRALLCARECLADQRLCVEYARARLELDGVDIDSWLPSSKLWIDETEPE